MLNEAMEILRSQTDSGIWEFWPGELGRGTGIFVSVKPMPKRNDGVKVIVSSYAYEIRSVIYSLKAIFEETLNFLNQFVFYARLADSAINHITVIGDNLGVIGAILDEAEMMAEEWKLMGDFGTAQLNTDQPGSFLSRVVKLKFQSASSVGSIAGYDKSRDATSLYLDSDCPQELIDLMERWQSHVTNYAYFEFSWPVKYERITFRYNGIPYSMRKNVIGVDSELFYEMEEDIANELVLMGAEDVFAGGMLD